MRDISPILRSLGLLDSEIKTYLAALELGPSTVIQLTGKTNISRQASYTAIEALIERGLMSSVEKGKKTLYASESPERLVAFAEAKMRNMESTLKDIKTVADDLHLLRKGEKPAVKMFEGKEGLHAMLQDIIDSGVETFDELANEDAVSSVFSDEDLKPYKAKFDEAGIKARFMSRAKQQEPIRKKAVRQYINRKDIDFNGDILIWDSKVAFLTFRGKMISVLIESKDIADTVRSLYQLAWDCDKK